MLVADPSLEPVSEEVVPITPRVLARLVTGINASSVVHGLPSDITLADLDGATTAGLSPAQVKELRRVVIDYVRQRWQRVAKVRPFADMPNGLALADLDLSVRAFNAMSRFPFKWLRTATIADVLDTPGLGAGVLVEVLAAYEAALSTRGMKVLEPVSTSDGVLPSGNAPDATSNEVQEDGPEDYLAMEPEPIPTRVREMRDLYDAGASLGDVAEQFDLSRERVRQLFNQHGIPTRSTAETAALRRDQLIDEYRGRIYELVDQGVAQNEICDRLRVPPQLVRDALEADPERRRLASFRRTKKAHYKPRYTDEEIIECLRQASHELGGVLTTAEYTSFARTRRFPDGRFWPGHQTAFLRFGSWRAALAKAGLESNPASAIAGQRIFTRAHCIDAILEVERELGHAPAAAEYERAAVASNGVLPSLATLRHRCGGWNQALLLAAQYSSS